MTADVWADLEAKARAAKAGGLSSGEWACDPHTQWITCEADNGYQVHVADIRGWGYLTGRGDVCLKLEEDPAYEIQKAWAAFIAAANPATILKLIEAARRSSEGEVVRWNEFDGDPVCIVQMTRRPDGGLRVFSPDLPGLILSGKEPAKVMECVWPAITALLDYKEARHPVTPDGGSDAEEIPSS